MPLSPEKFSEEKHAATEKVVAGRVHLRNSRKEDTMPYVNIRVAGTLTREQKEKIVGEVTESICRIANKPLESVMIFIDEVSPENISKLGKLLDSK